MQKFEYAHLTLNKYPVERDEIIEDIWVEYFHFYILFKTEGTLFTVNTRNGLKKEDFEAGTVRAFVSAYEKNFGLEKSKRQKNLDLISLFNFLGSHGWQMTGLKAAEEMKEEYFFVREF